MSGRSCGALPTAMTCRWSVQSARSLARGVVARLVADGARNTHEWTEKKAQLLTGLDEVGLTTVFMDPEDGGFIDGPKNLALALVAFELSWVDAGAATCSLASNLALSPIHEKGTPEQRSTLHEPLRPAAPGRGPQTVARRLRPDRTAPLCRRRHRHPLRQDARGGMGRWEGADPPGGKARPFHHQHGFCQFRDRGGRFRRSPDQGERHGHPRRGGPGDLRPRRNHPQAGAPALLHDAIRSSA